MLSRFLRNRVKQRRQKQNHRLPGLDRRPQFELLEDRRLLTTLSGTVSGPPDDNTSTPAASTFVETRSSTFPDQQQFNSSANARVVSFVADPNVERTYEWDIDVAINNKPSPTEAVRLIVDYHATLFASRNGFSQVVQLRGWIEGEQVFSMSKSDSGWLKEGSLDITTVGDHVNLEVYAFLSATEAFEASSIGWGFSVRIAPPVAGTLSDFADTGSLDRLAIESDGAMPTELAFYASQDGVFNPSADIEILQVDVTPESIAESDFLINLADLSEEPGNQRLLINPAASDGSALRTALENPAHEVIFAVGNPSGANPSVVPFRGIYQSEPGELAVLRTGPNTSDTVIVGPGTLNLAFTARNASDAIVKQSTANVGSASSVLIVTSDRDDVVDVAPGIATPLRIKAGAGNDDLEGGAGDDELDGGTGNDELHGGTGNDTYKFGASSGGSDRIHESGTGIDLLDFSSFPESIAVDLGHDAIQTIAAGLSLTLSSDDVIENVTGSDFADFLKGNALDNQIVGGKGGDVIVGAAGADTLSGDEGHDAILGDGFDLTLAEWGDVVEVFRSFLTGGTHDFQIALNPIEGDGDTIMGGSGDELIVGGDGDDTITAGVDRSLIFGDAFSLSSILDFEFSTAFSDLSLAGRLLATTPTFQLTGDGVDTITGGTAENIIIGGGGNDEIFGGNGALDFLFGNEGADNIVGQAGFNFIVGGVGGDESIEDGETLFGGPDLDIIVGDDLQFTANSLDISSLTSFIPGSPAAAIQKFANLLNAPDEETEYQTFLGLQLIGAGENTINTGDGVNLVAGGGGTDVIEGGGGLIDVIYGNAGFDRIEGKEGVDFIVGGDGSDRIWGGAEAVPDAYANVLFGDNVDVDIDFDLTSLLDGRLEMPGVNIELTGDGFDEIYGGNDFDFIVGGNGTDTMYGGNGTNIVFGDDFSIVGEAFKFISTLVNPVKSAAVEFARSVVEGAIGAVYAFFSGSEGDTRANLDIYYGGTGSDYVFGGDGPDRLFGDPGSTSVSFDILVGGFDDDDIVVPGAGGTIASWAKVAWGGPGDDTITGSAGADLLGSSSGNDTFYGGDGSDTIYGGDGADQLYGGPGDDHLFGEAGDDLLVSGSGTDSIVDEQGVNRVIIGPDYDGSGVVDAPDHAVWTSSFGSTLSLAADGNGDGIVNAADYVVWRDSLGAGVTGNATAEHLSRSLTTGGREVDSTIADFATAEPFEYIDAGSIDHLESQLPITRAYASRRQAPLERELDSDNLLLLLAENQLVRRNKHISDIPARTSDRATVLRDAAFDTDLRIENWFAPAVTLEL